MKTQLQNPSILSGTNPSVQLNRLHPIKKTLHCILCLSALLSFVEPHRSAWAVQAPDHPSLPNRDTRPQSAAPAALADKARMESASRLKGMVEGLEVDWHEATGAPKWIRVKSGFLTNAKGAGRAIPAARMNGFAAGDPHRVIKAFLNEHSALFGQDAPVLNDSKVARDYVTNHNGVRTVVWYQHLDGIPVFEGLLSYHLTKNEELVSIASQMIPDAPGAADRGHRNRKALQARPAIAPAQAVIIAAKDIEEPVSSDSLIELPRRTKDQSDQHRFAALQVLIGATNASLIWLPTDGKTMRLCWDVTLTGRKHGGMYRVLVDAETGEAPVRQCLTSYLSNASYRVFVSDSPSPFSPGWATPNAGQPSLATRSLVTLDALNTTASPNGWINDGVNETRGNTVDAQTVDGVRKARDGLDRRVVGEYNDVGGH